MPIASNKSIGFLHATKIMSTEDKQRLIALVHEMQDRGLQIPRELLDQTSARWYPDENGYFVQTSSGRHYNPYQSQTDFINSNARFSLFYGSRGSGKTASGAQKALRKIQQGLNGAILNPDFENFRISTWPEFKEWIPWDNVVVAHRYRRTEQWQPYQPFVMAFTNGARVICKGLKEPGSGRGPNINWLWYDEPSRDETGESWQISIASVRIGYMPQAWATGTPSTKAPWVRKFFIDKDIPEDAIEAFKLEGLGRELVDCYYGNIEMNKNNLDPGYYAAMLAAYPSGWLRKQEIMGLFVDESGTLGDSSWFKDKIIAEPPERVTSRLRFWDMAATEKKLAGKKKNDPDASSSTLMSFIKEENKFIIEDQTNAFMKWEELIEEIVRVTQEDGLGVKVYMEQEPAAGGKNQVAVVDLELKKRIPGHPGCTGYRPTDRVISANIWFGEAAAGQMYLVYGAWNKPFLNQLDEFPGSSHTHDDRITSVTGARLNIAPIKKWKSISFLHL